MTNTILAAFIIHTQHNQSRQVTVTFSVTKPPAFKPTFCFLLQKKDEIKQENMIILSIFLWFQLHLLIYLPYHY